MTRRARRPKLRGHTVGTVAYGYNEAGRLGGITSDAGEFAFAYDDMGRRTSLDFPNGVTATYDYNDTGRLVNLAHTTSTGLEIVANAYTHDAVGNRTINTDQARGALYSYDTLYRLTEANYTTTGWSGVESGAKGKGGKAKNDKTSNPTAIDNQTERYTYDAVGNRLTAEKSRTYTYNDVNQLTSANGTSYIYDKNGNLVQKSGANGIVTYTYNYENKLVKVANSDGTVVEFKYDPFGRRIEKAVLGGDTNRYFYDAEDIFFEYDSSGTVGNRYTHGPGVDEPLALSNNKGNYYYHADGLGSVVALTDATQEVVQDYQYGFFGDLKDQKNRIKQPYRYTAREWDKETGLYFYRARYYDAGVGRFTQKDPIGFRGGINLYTYVGGNPINYIDPWGLEANITVWQPVGWGQSSFGHVSTSINNVTFTYAPGGMTVMRTSDYLSRNDFREGVTSSLDLTAEEEKRLQSCIVNKSGDEYGMFLNNCGDPVESCLEELGYELGWNLFPVSLGDSLIDSGIVKGFYFHDATQPSNGSSAPWAK